MASDADPQAGSALVQVAGIDADNAAPVLSYSCGHREYVSESGRLLILETVDRLATIHPG